MLYGRDYFDKKIPYRNADKRREYEDLVEIEVLNTPVGTENLIKNYLGGLYSSDFETFSENFPEMIESGETLIETIDPTSLKMKPLVGSKSAYDRFLRNENFLDSFTHQIIGVLVKASTFLTDREPKIILTCEFIAPATYKILRSDQKYRQHLFKYGPVSKEINLKNSRSFNKLFEKWITGGYKSASLKKADFYREVSPPDQLSSLTQGTPIGRADNPDGTNPHSALPNGDSSRNIGRPSPDSPNLKYRNLDRADAYGRTPSEGFDRGYVHDSGSGSARVIPYDSGFTNNSSALRKSAKVFSDRMQREINNRVLSITRRGDS